MKKHTILFISFFIVSGFLGCKKNLLDETPSGRINLDATFADINLTRGYLASVYTNLPDYFSGYYFNATLAPKSDEASDADQGSNAFSSAQWNSGQLSVSSNPLQPSGNVNVNGFYPIDWTGIRRANVYIANVDKVTVMPESERRTTKGEAMALRAYYFFELIKFHGGMPIINNVLTTDYDFTQLKRNTFDECSRWIAGQCDSAALLMESIPRRNTSDIGRVSKGFALALKSRALLYNASPLHNPGNDAAKWQAAAAASKQVLDMADQGVYGLFNNYYTIFTQQDKGIVDQNFKEVIFQLPRRRGDFHYVNGIPTANNFKAGTCPSQELVDAYPMLNGEQPVTGYNDEDHTQPVINTTSGYDPQNPYANRDPRLTASVFYNGVLWGKRGGVDKFIQSYVGGAEGIRENDRSFTRTGYYIKKYVDPTAGSGDANIGSNTAQSYWIIFRLAEFYLNYAEALNEVSGPTADVYAAVNKIRTRAGIAAIPAGLTKEQMRERIHNERRVELAFEEHRFFDVRRWKILNQTDKVLTGMRITQTSPGQFTYNRVVIERRAAFADKFLLFPVPVSEISKMPGVTQTPGW